MKTLFSKLAVACLFLTFVGCSSEDSPNENTSTAPTADFSFTGNNSPAPAPIVFQNNSTNATDYLWDFGDDQISTEKNPTHTYTIAGTYTVTLTVAGNGGTTSKTKTIEITAPVNPTTAKITKITMTEMSFQNDNGYDWDSTSAPDVQFNITDYETYQYLVSSSVYNNVLESQLPLVWTLATPHLISDLSKEYALEVHEMDGTMGEGIAAYSLIMSDYTSGSNPYPTQITLTNTNYGTTTVVLDVTWQ